MVTPAKTSVDVVAKLVALDREATPPGPRDENVKRWTDIF